MQAAHNMLDDLNLDQEDIKDGRVPSWYLDMLPPSVEEHECVSQLFWDAHELKGVSNNMILSRVVDIVSAAVLGDTQQDEDRRRHINLVVPLHKHMAGNKVSATALEITLALIGVYEPFLKPLVNAGNAQYVQIYIRKVAARMLKAKGIYPDCSSLMRVCASTDELTRLINNVKSTVPKLKIDSGLTFDAEAFMEDDDFISSDSFSTACYLLLPYSLAKFVVTFVGQAATPSSKARIVAAGGFCTSLVRLLLQGQVSKCTDVDLYIVTGGERRDFQLSEACCNIVHHVNQALPPGRRQESIMFVAETKQTMTFAIRSSGAPITEMVQLSLREYRDIESIPLSYDLDCCSIVFDGTKLHLTEAAVHALAHDTTTIDPLQHTRAERVMKYSSKKGFNFVIPADLSDPCLQSLTSFLKEGACNVGNRVARSLLNDAWNVGQLLALKSHPKVCKNLADPSDAQTLLHLLKNTGEQPRHGSGNTRAAGEASDVDDLNRDDDMGHANRSYVCVRPSDALNMSLIPDTYDGVVGVLSGHVRPYAEPEDEDIVFIKSLSFESKKLLSPFDRSVYSQGSRGNFYILPAKAAHLANQYTVEQHKELQRRHAELKDKLRVLQEEIAQFQIQAA